MSVEEKIEHGTKKKEQGNILYKGNRFNEAVEKYDVCLKLFRYENKDYSEEQKKKIDSLKVKLFKIIIIIIKKTIQTES